jgi:TRAP-type C4-dicarboxylate transport system permease small subunit
VLGDSVVIATAAILSAYEYCAAILLIVAVVVTHWSVVGYFGLNQ